MARNGCLCRVANDVFTMSKPDPERVLTKPLVAFLVLVAAVVVVSIVTRHPRVDLEGAIELLADGDLDHQERQRMLLQTMDLAQQATSLRQRWAGLLAAVALQDRQAFAVLEARLGVGAALPEEEREWVALGDPLLANVLAAMCAQASENKTLARVKWAQVAAQARMTGHAFAAELARR